MNLIIIVSFVVILLAMFIFWTAFRNWVGRQLNTIWGFVTLYAPAVATWLVNAFRSVVIAISIYAFILLWATLIALVLMAIALLINSPGLTAFTFVFAICLVLFTWLPAGILLRLFHITDGVVPKTLKMLVAWTAFVGFLGLMCPDVLTAKTLMGAALVGFIFLGIATKLNALDWIVFPLVVVMCLWTAYGYFWPESYRSSTRWVESVAKKNQATKDRSSIGNETDAATTYGVVLRDISVLYTLDVPNSSADILTEHEISLKTGTIVKISNRKQEVRVIDGQGFVWIQLAKGNSSFVNGRKYWVEAEYVQLATPREVTPENDDLLKKQSVRNTEVMKDSIFTKGVYYIPVKGKTPFWIHVKSNACSKYATRVEKGEYDLNYYGGLVITDSPKRSIVLPNLPEPRFWLSGDNIVRIEVF